MGEHGRPCWTMNELLVISYHVSENHGRCNHGAHLNFIAAGIVLEVTALGETTPRRSTDKCPLGSAEGESLARNFPCRWVTLTNIHYK